MSKSRIKGIRTIKQVRSELKNILDNKYYNLWMSKYETDLDPQLYNYMFKKFWETGTIAGFKVKHTDELGVTTYTTQAYNLYDYPEVVELVNVRNSAVIPHGPKTVDKDVVIGFCQSNHKSIKSVVDKYISRILEVEMVINTQLETHKLPFLVAITPEDKDKANDIIDRIINNEPVVFMDFQELSMVKVLVNNNAYILDKLVEYKQSIECELLTFMGLDNAVSQKVNLDITNANNNLINAFKDDIDYNIQNFVNDCKEYLGIDFYLNMRQSDVLSIYEENATELENNTTKEGIEHDVQEG